MRSSWLSCALALPLLIPSALRAQQVNSVAAIQQSIRGLRQLPEAERGAHVGELAHEIAALPASADKLKLANGLAHLATEGDPGRDNLQAVTDALSKALTETPMPGLKASAASPYVELATLQRYEGLRVDGAITADPQFKEAAEGLAAHDEEVSKLDFTMKDIHGKKWTKSELVGKVVLLNFWATWCPPCRQELPNLDAIAAHYAPAGLVVLAVTNEDAAKVNAMFRDTTPHFTVLFDANNKVGTAFGVQSLPRTLVFDREGKLAAVAMDARTQRQFLLMLKTAGLQL